MPLPHPTASESRDSYVSRFMADENAKREFPDEDQRLAVAFKKWKERLSKAAETMLRRIKQATITTIALCRRGKNGMKTLFKSDGTVEFGTLVKAGADNELLAVVYAPDRPDDDGDFAEAPVIKAMAYEYLRDHRGLDLEHDGKKLPNSAAYVAESFIVAKGDERFADWKDYDGNPVGDLSGAWANVIKLEDPALQKAYREGALDGVSMFGRAAVEPVDTQAAAKRVAEALGKAHGTQGENEMTQEEMKALLSGFKAEVVTMVKSAVEELVKPKAPETNKDEPKAPVFKGNVTDPKDLEQFENELRAYEMQKALAAGTLSADKIAEMRKALAVGEPTDAEAGVESTDTPTEKDLKRQLFKARKARNAPERKGDDGSDSEAELRKANEAEGKAIAALVNERRGSASMKVVQS